MREQLKKEAGKRCQAYVQSAAAQAAYEKSLSQLTAKYDRLVQEGNGELDAYRALLADVEAMQLMLAAMPPSLEEVKRKQQKEEETARKKRLKRIFGGLQGIQWILTILLYFVISFTFGFWHLTWLLFLSGAVGSLLLEIAEKYMNGTPLGKISQWHGVFWLCLIITYFLVSFLSGRWELTWLMFPCGTIVEIVYGIIH